MEISRKKILFAAFAVVGGLILLSYLWGLVVALELDREPRHVYPWSIYVVMFNEGHKTIVSNAIWDMLVIPVALVAIFFILIFHLKPRQSLFGDAKWASEKEMEKYGLFSGNGLLVGRVGTFFKRWVFLPFSPMIFLMMYAPTRRGKGVSFVIPNLLNWLHSVVVTDIKLENFELTSGFRKRCGHDVYLLNFSPKNYKSHCWNALDYISENPDFRIGDIKKIGVSLIREGDNSDGDIWVPEARNLFLGIVLFLLESDGEFPVTLGEVYRQLNPKNDLGAYVKYLIGKYELSPECERALSSFANTPDKTRGGIKNQINIAMDKFGDPLLDAVTSRSDFYLGDVRKKKTTIYLGVTPNELGTMKDVIALFWEQLINVNTEVLPSHNKSLKYQVLLLMDEFTAFGRLRIIENAIGYMAGYGLRFCPVFQSRSQLVDKYSPEIAENMEDNCGAWAVMSPRRAKAAEELANEIGYITTESRSKGRSSSDGKTTRSKNESETKRHLILPQDIKNMPENQMLLLMDQKKPMRVESIRYFKMKEFKARLLPPIDVDDIDIQRYPVRGFNETVSKDDLSDDEIYEEVMPDGEYDSLDVPEIDINNGEDMDDFCVEFLSGLVN
jgi:type IV secretion system protein VirD4